jgi:hypothetical protein
MDRLREWRDADLSDVLAPKTAAGYKSGASSYESFCEFYGLDQWKQTDDQLSLFAKFRQAYGDCAGTIRNKLYAVRDMFVRHPTHSGEWKAFTNSQIFPKLNRLLNGYEKDRMRLGSEEMKREPIPLSELAKLREAFREVATSVVAGLAYWLAALIMLLAARRPGELFSSVVLAVHVAGPTLCQVTFLPEGSSPKECQTMILTLAEVKNRKKGPRYEIAVPNVPGTFSVGDAFAAMWGNDLKKLRNHADAPLFMDTQKADMSYNNFYGGMDRAGQLLGWREEWRYPYCLKITAMTRAGQMGLSDHEMRQVGDWSSDAYLVYNKLSLVQRSELLARLAMTMDRPSAEVATPPEGKRQTGVVKLNAVPPVSPAPTASRKERKEMVKPHLGRKKRIKLIILKRPKA